MVYSAVNHSYDSKRTIKILSGIITIVYSSINRSADSNRSPGSTLAPTNKTQAIMTT